MPEEKILVIGACGQIGVELTLALRYSFGEEAVIAADIRPEPHVLRNSGRFIPIDIMDRETLAIQVRRYRVTQVYFSSIKQHLITT